MIEAVERGANPRAAVFRAFQDRLRDAVLRAMGEPVTSTEELRATDATGGGALLFA